MDIAPGMFRLIAKDSKGQVSIVDQEKSEKAVNEVLHKLQEEQRIAFEKKGRESWTFKHSYFGCNPQWHELWKTTIPKADCLCSEDYAKLEAEYPPDFSSPENYFAWGVFIHNKVNEKLGKAQMSLETAKIVWNR